MDNVSFEKFCSDILPYIDLTEKQLKSNLSLMRGVVSGEAVYISREQQFLTRNYKHADDLVSKWGYCDLALVTSSRRKKNCFDIGVYWSRDDVVRPYCSFNFLDLKFDAEKFRRAYLQFVRLLEDICVDDKIANQLRKEHFELNYRKLVYEAGKRPVDTKIILPELKAMAACYGPEDNLLPKHRSVSSVDTDVAK